MDQGMKCEIAKKARAFMSDESKWTRNDYGITQEGISLSPREVRDLSNEVIKVCIIGAYCLFGLSRSEAIELIQPKLRGHWDTPESFNNNLNTQFSDIIQVMDKVIEGECSTK